MKDKYFHLMKDAGTSPWPCWPGLQLHSHGASRNWSWSNSSCKVVADILSDRSICLIPPRVRKLERKHIFPSVSIISIVQLCLAPICTLIHYTFYSWLIKTVCSKSQNLATKKFLFSSLWICYSFFASQNIITENWSLMFAIIELLRRCELWSLSAGLQYSPRLWCQHTASPACRTSSRSRPPPSRSPCSSPWQRWRLPQPGERPRVQTFLEKRLLWVRRARRVLP